MHWMPVSKLDYDKWMLHSADIPCERRILIHNAGTVCARGCNIIYTGILSNRKIVSDVNTWILDRRNAIDGGNICGGW